MRVISLASGEESRKTGYVRRAEVSGRIPQLQDFLRGIEIPPPKVTDTSMPFDEMALHLAKLYKQAVKLSGAPVDKPIKYFHIAKNVLSKNQFDLARRMKASLRKISDESNSKLPMSMYTWWYVNMVYEKFKDIPFPAKVFNPDQIASAKWRKYYWSDCGAVVATMPRLWADADQELLEIHRAIHTYDADCLSVEHAAWLWEVEFSLRYAEVSAKASRQRRIIKEALDAAYNAYDIRLYLMDPVKVLKLTNLARCKLV